MPKTLDNPFGLGYIRFIEERNEPEKGNGTQETETLEPAPRKEAHKLTNQSHTKSSRPQDNPSNERKRKMYLLIDDAGDKKLMATLSDDELESCIEGWGEGFLLDIIKIDQIDGEVKVYFYDGIEFIEQSRE